MRGTTVSLLLVTFGATCLAAQSAPTESVRFASMATDLDSTLAMGRTLLQSARRMFPDAPQVYAGRSLYSINDGNPQPIDRSPVMWEVAGASIEPKYVFQTGPGRWTLYFDANQRLVVATRDRPHPALSFTDFASRYPSLHLAQAGHGYEAYEGRVDACQVLSVIFAKPNKALLSYSYTFTCATAQPPK